jgi:hypothetical protein
MANQDVCRLLRPKDGRDDQHIDPQNDADIARWSKKLGVPKDELRSAAEQAGPRLGDIRQHLVGGFTSGGPTS